MTIRVSQIIIPNQAECPECSTMRALTTENKISVHWPKGEDGDARVPQCKGVGAVAEPVEERER